MIYLLIVSLENLFTLSKKIHEDHRTTSIVLNYQELLFEKSIWSFHSFLTAQIVELRTQDKYNTTSVFESKYLTKVQLAEMKLLMLVTVFTFFSEVLSTQASKTVISFQDILALQSLLSEFRMLLYKPLKSFDIFFLFIFVTIKSDYISF
ncbi:hypothetical protein BD560DRAFT_491892 [Blakeslea trispora]|nr:hypothetical protein BD560DRAFT_491892 [Blakeslea trispora]